MKKSIILFGFSGSFKLGQPDLVKNSYYKSCLFPRLWVGKIYFQINYQFCLYRSASEKLTSLLTAFGICLKSPWVDTFPYFTVKIKAHSCQDTKDPIDTRDYSWYKSIMLHIPLKKKKSFVILSCVNWVFPNLS